MADNDLWLFLVPAIAPLSFPVAQMASERLGIADNLAIFRKFRKALKPGGTLLINDFILNDDRTGHPFAMMFASQMLLVSKGGNSWRQSDYRTWLVEAGFASVDIVPTSSPATVVFAE